MQKNSIQTLSKLAVPLKSKGRFFNEKKTHLRSDFQRDREMIGESFSINNPKALASCGCGLSFSV